MKLGLIIDLTNTTRFYDKTEVERAGIKHVKMNCKGLVKYYFVLCLSFLQQFTAYMHPREAENIELSISQDIKQKNALFSVFYSQMQGFQ